ncbi:MAG: 4-alpha-glucanotransferase [Chitinophagaceae bacterium]
MATENNSIENSSAENSVVKKENAKKELAANKIADEKKTIKKDQKKIKVADKNTDKKNAINQELINAYTEDNSALLEENIPAKKSASKKIKKAAEKKSEVKTKAAKPLKKVQLKTKKPTQPSLLKVTLQLRFSTKFGQTIFVTGNHELFGNYDINNALPLQYLNEEFWFIELHISPEYFTEPVNYNYILKNTDGTTSYDWGNDKMLEFNDYKSKEIFIIDFWNYAGYFENAFYTKPFKNVLLKNNFTALEIKTPIKFTHTFKIKVPLINKNEVVCLTGDAEVLGEWKEGKAKLMSRTEDEDFWTVKVDLSKTSFPVIYKYGVYDIEQKTFVYEKGINRILSDEITDKKQTIINDGFIALPNDTWKGAGVAIPVFSLKSNNSFGVGEFTDIKLLVDWAKQTGLKLIQILPVSDTTATHTWLDSYPYAAISAFALHPMYLNVDKFVEEENKYLLEEFSKAKNRLNNLDDLDYEVVNNVKWKIIEKVYPLQAQKIFSSKEYQDFFENNRHWLVPYAAFCFFREKNNTADFNNWSSHKKYSEEDIQTVMNDAENVDAISIYFFVQYYLHLQLKEATEYAHKNGVILKGDTPIGVYRYSVDAWQQPELFHMNLQAGAPPDEFAVKGQNWRFPTYNWQQMQQDNFAWWKQRFNQMKYYFDAFRIDHILGFFRIWSIPENSVEGIMGYFDPAIPVYFIEFLEKGIWFDYNRYCKPFINEQILYELFGAENNFIKKEFLNAIGYGYYELKALFVTQQQVKDYFDKEENNDLNKRLKQGLFDLISNVILFEAEGSNQQQFHFRYAMDTTSSFKNLEYGTQQQLRELYINYFFVRQDEFWKKQALQKLPQLKRATNMLVCGEDLGMVPHCVPEVMKQLGILSLEIQRMPKNMKRDFFHLADAPYLSVVTPSTHDMNTIRGWWEEDRNRTQKFYNEELGESGDAPFLCEPIINQLIIIQHLHSPAMWSIFQLQDLLGMDKNLRRPNPHEERINIPANSKNYWKYRMHLTLENLINATNFSEELNSYIKASGR